MQAKIEKPVVYFSGTPYFWMWNPTNEVASLEVVLGHPHLGDCPNVRTSTVKQKFDDGSFETRNTIYKPATCEMLNEYNERIERNAKELREKLEELYKNNELTFSQTGLARKEK